MQDVAWIASLIGMAVVAVAFVWVAAGASNPGGDSTTIARSAFQWRGRMFWVVIVAGSIISVVTLWDWPIAGHATAANRPDAVVSAVGHQWRWELDRDTVRTGELVESGSPARREHGFAIYKTRAHDRAGAGHARLRQQLQVRSRSPVI